MKNIAKICISALALVSMGSVATAQTLSPANTAVTASGQLTQSLNGSLFTTVCNVQLVGTTDSTGITFTSMTGTSVSGPLSCDDGLVFPLRVDATSPTSVTIKNMEVSTRLGDCGPEDVVGAWSNATSTAGPLAAALSGWFGTCNASGSLTVSPAITIN